MQFATAARAVVCAVLPRKRSTFCSIIVVVVLTAAAFNSKSSPFPREEHMEQRLTKMKAHLQFLSSLYRQRQEDIMGLQTKILDKSSFNYPNPLQRPPTAGMTPNLIALLSNMTGMKAVDGLDPGKLDMIRSPFVFQLLPHLMSDPYSLRPVYHLKGRRDFVDMVLGIPTVRRDKESYLMITLSHLVDGLGASNINSTVIVVFVGETDLEFVLRTARQIESLYPQQVKSGLIEVMSPSASYYPDFDYLQATLGDSNKRFKWRTKQNLDTLYLMTYAQTKGTYYLMLEDDVIARKDYMNDIKAFTAGASVTNPQWFFIEYSPVGGIGKLFRSADLPHFVTYVQLFYNNLPIDWLLESYLADRVCTIDKSSKQCIKSKLEIRPKYKTSLFLHIGLYSSLKGKIQKVKDPHYGPIPTFYPHVNPPLQRIRSDIADHAAHTLRKAYNGHSFFWGVKPKKGDLVEFWFQRPTAIERYTFRSGNVEHVSDKFYDTSVEILRHHGDGNYTEVGSFDEFGLADGKLTRDVGPLKAMRLKVNRDSFYWVILSERPRDTLAFVVQCLMNGQSASNLTATKARRLLPLKITSCIDLRPFEPVI